MKKLFIVWTLFSVTGFAMAGPQGNAAIRIEVGGLRNARGSIFCQLFGTEAGFPETGGVAVVSTPIERSIRASGGPMLSASCTFTRLARGTWAVAVFHDENGDRKLNKNIFGASSEGHGASNNVTHAFSAPKWSESSFALSDGETKVVPVVLHY